MYLAFVFTDSLTYLFLFSSKTWRETFLYIFSFSSLIWVYRNFHCRKWISAETSLRKILILIKIQFASKTKSKQWHSEGFLSLWPLFLCFILCFIWRLETGSMIFSLPLFIFGRIRISIVPSLGYYMSIYLGRCYPFLFSSNFPG